MTGDSLLTVAGVGGATVCCLSLELLGGAALLSGLAAMLGISPETAYATAVGIGGVLATGLVVLYQFGGMFDD